MSQLDSQWGAFPDRSSATLPLGSALARGGITLSDASSKAPSQVVIGAARLVSELEEAEASGQRPDLVLARGDALPDSFAATVQGWTERVDRLFAQDSVRSESLRALVTVRRDTLELAPLLELPLWRRVAGLSVPRTAVVADLASMDFPRQVRTLARLMTLADAATPLDFEVVARAVHPELRPALVHWFLRTYLRSPLTNADAEVERNRRLAAEGFVRYFGDRVLPMPTRSPLPSVPPGYAALEAVVVDRLVGPTMERATDFVSPAAFPVRLAARADIGLVVEAQSPSVCMPATDLAVAQALTGRRALAISVSGAMPTGVFAGRPTLTAGDGSIQSLAQLSERVVAEELALLVRTKPGSTRVGALGWRRLARTIMVVGGGLPLAGEALGATPATDADVIVVGELVAGGLPAVGLPAGDGRRRHVVPGLGAWFRTTPPSRPRLRSVSEPQVQVASLAPASLLVSPLLRLWDAALPSSATLRVVPGVNGSAADRAAAELAAELSHTNLTLSPVGSPTATANWLADADMYLHAPGDFGALAALAAGCPVVAWGGGDGLVPALMRALGLPSWLIAYRSSDYAQAARALSSDAALRAEIRAMIDPETVSRRLMDPELPTYLRTAIDEAQGGR